MDNTSIALESINDKALGTYNSTHDFKSNSLESKYEVKCFNTDGYTMTGVVKNRNGNRRLLSIEEGKIKLKEIWGLNIFIKNYYALVFVFFY